MEDDQAPVGGGGCAGGTGGSAGGPGWSEPVPYWPPRDLPPRDDYPLAPPATAGPAGLRRRTVVLAGAGVAVLAVAGVAIGIGASSGAPRTASATVAASVGRALSDRTARIELTMHVDGLGQQVDASGPGQIDFTTGSLLVTLGMDVSSTSLTVPVVYSGGTVYEKVPELSTLEPGRSWATIGMGASAGGAGALGSGGNPAAMLALLEQKGATVTDLGPHTVDGAATTAYDVVIPKSMVEHAIADAHLPSWMRQAASQVDIGNTQETVYIDRAQHLRRVTIHVDEAAAGNTISVDETMTLSDYGLPVHVTIPPASETVPLQQVIQDARSAGQG